MIRPMNTVTSSFALKASFLRITRSRKYSNMDAMLCSVMRTYLFTFSHREWIFETTSLKSKLSSIQKTYGLMDSSSTIPRTISGHFLYASDGAIFQLTSQSRYLSRSLECMTKHSLMSPTITTLGSSIPASSKRLR